MLTTVKTALIAGVLLFVAGWFVGYFGVRHEIAQIPEVQRKTMTDFDWTGADWVFRGMALSGVGALLALVSGVVLWIRRARTAV